MPVAPAHYVDAYGSQERRSFPFSPVSVVLVNDALQLALALLAVQLRVGLPQLFTDADAGVGGGYAMLP
ncbi:hypothetical protein AK812_SmicGene8550 [Symbiodinium microadriaticum]|uniref:Uncharacterized protein n=1 Tax=Symbiodinium microadriaticum TaxID=2951 RepID=A0A1Q9EKL4_SYMMI|nr:hypothetical protein AK812_SmicGene8550 [Symbiodinium microadriaticum]